MLAGSDVFLNLTEERGLTVQRYAARTIETLCLLRPQTRTLNPAADAKLCLSSRSDVPHLEDEQLGGRNVLV
jgi:hypothetical protein